MRLLRNPFRRRQNHQQRDGDVVVEKKNSGLSDAQVGQVLNDIRPFTMVHESGVEFTMRRVIDVIDGSVPGALVECGVWRGGCGLSMLLAQRIAFGEVQRPVYLLDSFEGLPRAEKRDGQLALEWQKGNSETFFDNCFASESEVRSTLEKFGFREGEFHIVKGWFEETVPPLSQRLANDGISLLRLDGDWYKSTIVCLEHLEPLVSVDGIVLIDDYYAWDGCARAVHDYLSRKDIPYRIKSLPHYFAAYFEKRPYRERFDQF